MRDMLRKNGIVCQQAAPAFMVSNEAGIDVFGALWRYRRPKTGQMIWIIEIAICLSSDETVSRSWVLDAAPASGQIDTIITNNAQAGAVIE